LQTIDLQLLFRFSISNAESGLKLIIGRHSRYPLQVPLKASAAFHC